MIRLTQGVTRMVLLIGPYAIKLPHLLNGWPHFLHGLLSNIAEVRFTPLADKFHLAPTLFGIPGGWLNVQRRCEPLTDEQWLDVELSGGEAADFGHSDWHGFMCDLKRVNFGSIDGHVVLLDYGEMT